MLLPQGTNRPLCLCLCLGVCLLALAATLPLRAVTVKPELVSSATNLKFGGVSLGNKETQVIVLTNVGTSSVTLSAISVSGSEFSASGPKIPLIVEKGASVAVDITFAPTVSGWVERQLTFTSNATDPELVVHIVGRGVTSEPLVAVPASLSFGNVTVGSEATLGVSVTNSSSSAQTILGFQAVGIGFSISDPPGPVVLDPGKTIKLNIAFAPKLAGLSAGSLFVYGPALDVPLSGTGTAATVAGQLSITPGSLNFGNVMVGTTDTQAASLKATGGSVTVSSAASSASVFVLSGTVFPLTIDAGSSVQFKVAFTPQNAGSASATLSFSSDATNGAVKEPLAGTGTAPQVKLTWTASTSAVSGYNIYRRLAASGSYTKVNTSLDTDTWFTDTSVVPGKTYEYVTTAVNASGQESPYSTPAEIEVP